MFGYSGPMWDLSYLANLVAPVGSATESEELVPLSEDSESDPFWSPLTASVSLRSSVLWDFVPVFSVNTTASLFLTLLVSWFTGESTPRAS